MNNLHSIVLMNVHSSDESDTDGQHLRRLQRLQQQPPASMADSMVEFDSLQCLILLVLFENISFFFFVNCYINAID